MRTHLASFLHAFKRHAIARTVAITFVILISTLSLAATGGLDAPEPVGPYFNHVFPARAPGPSGDWTVELAFPNLDFRIPMFLVPYPGTNRLVLLEKAGIAYMFENDPNTSTREVFLDIRSQVFSKSDSGLTGCAFHPEFGQADSPNRGYVYITYKWTPDRSHPERDGYWRLSRFTVPDGQQHVNPDSELVLIQQYDRDVLHDSGHLIFGSDGFLYAGIGDEGRGDDVFRVSQTISKRLFSGILRIDVDQDPMRSHPIRRQPEVLDDKPAGWPDSFTQAYAIPNDNPFVDPEGGHLEEFYAFGLRNPYKFFQDLRTDLIWVGDIGQDAREELDVLIKGGNYQWAFKEGSIDGPHNPPDPIIGAQVAPSWEYDRDLGRALISGPFYRGRAHPTLRDKLILVDNGSYRVWALTTLGDAVTDVEFLMIIPPGRGSSKGPSMIGQDTSGEVYILMLETTETGKGGIYKLARSEPVISEPPSRLSQTGIFVDLATLTPAPGVIPYRVNAPHWSDGATQKRWIILPNDGSHDAPEEKIGFHPTRAWTFPPGTVFVKHLELPVDATNPLTTMRIETQVLVTGENGGAYGLSYQWLDNQSDALLLTAGATKDIAITLQDGGTRAQQWDFASRSQCLQCHNPNAGYILGVNTHQLNGDLLYPRTGRMANQLSTLGALGWFDDTYDASLVPSYLKMFHILDASAPLADRVRSYLDANCSQCHRPGGVRGYIDTRYNTPLERQNLIYGPLFDRIVVPDEHAIVPGDTAHSTVHRLTNQVGDRQMPPLVKNVVDTQATQVMQTWIDGLAVNPGVILTSPPIATETFVVRVTFTTGVTGLADTDFLTTNGIVSQLTEHEAGKVYELHIIPNLEGPVSVFLPENSATDAAQLGNYASNVLTVYYRNATLTN